MSERIQNIFSTGASSRIKGTVAGRGADGIYIIRTGAGVRIRAEAEEIYTLGERVTVFEGRILGRTGGRAAGRVFDV